jgi:hypothetical protein
MATLAANDQENAVRRLHAGAAGKSLNAGLKSFNAKTPGNKAPKTPFKVPLNDENAVGKPGNTKAGGKIDANAFVTPAGKTRADRLRKPTTDVFRSAQSRAAGHEDDQRQIQGLCYPSASLIRRKDAETEPSHAPPQSQDSPTRTCPRV